MVTRLILLSKENTRKAPQSQYSQLSLLTSRPLVPKPAQSFVSCAQSSDFQGVGFLGFVLLLLFCFVSFLQNTLLC